MAFKDARCSQKSFELISDQFPGVFCTPKFNEGAAVAVLFERHLDGDKEKQSRFVVLLGTMNNGNLGFYIQVCQPSYTYQQVEKLHEERYDSYSRTSPSYTKMRYSSASSDFYTILRSEWRPFHPSSIETTLSHTTAFSDVGYHKVLRKFAHHSVSVHVGFVHHPSASSDVAMSNLLKDLEIEISVNDDIGEPSPWLDILLLPDCAGSEDRSDYVGLICLTDD